MTKLAVAVIGANYGDCGKGLMTDYFCNQALEQNQSVVVVRSNGGSQAGHTVVTPEGDRHVFSHFGSGSFLGVVTFLSEFFITNPILFRKEYIELVAKNTIPKVIIDPQSVITTPFDMILNQYRENCRGDKRHGSVGLGIGETVARNENGLTLTIYDITQLSDYDLCIQLNEIRIHVINSIYKPEFLPVDIFDNDICTEIICKFLDDCAFLKHHCELQYSKYLLNFDTLIFEAGQGLLLDVEYGSFPYVTRSRCGAHNISAILDQISFNGVVSLNYVSRAYMTRHGAGPLCNEAVMPGFVVDVTNIPNEYQGSLRYAPLDIELLLNRISLDSRYCNSNNYSMTSNIIVTCLDQLDSELLCNEVKRRALITISALQSYGPVRTDVVGNI